MGLKKLIIFFAFIILPSLVRAEDITITTYYPSPYGSYKDLEVSNTLNLGTNLATSHGLIRLRYSYGADLNYAGFIEHAGDQGWPSYFGGLIIGSGGLTAGGAKIRFRTGVVPVYPDDSLRMAENEAYTRMIIDDVGRVGIGTTSPKARLDLGSLGGNMFVLNPSATTSSNYSGFYHNDLIMGSYVDGSSYSHGFISNGYVNDGGRKFHIGTASDGNFNAATAFTPIMTVDSTNQNVGIGTTSPAAKLEVKNSVVSGGITRTVTVKLADLTPGTVCSACTGTAKGCSTSSATCIDCCSGNWDDLHGCYVNDIATPEQPECAGDLGCICFEHGCSWDPIISKCFCPVYNTASCSSDVCSGQAGCDGGTCCEMANKSGSIPKGIEVTIDPRDKGSAGQFTGDVNITGNLNVTGGNTQVDTITAKCTGDWTGKVNWCISKVQDKATWLWAAYTCGNMGAEICSPSQIFNSRGGSITCGADNNDADSDNERWSSQLRDTGIAYTVVSNASWGDCGGFGYQNMNNRRKYYCCKYIRLY